MHRSYSYLALGDSYTIGESVLLQESFPYQAVQMLRKGGHDFGAPEIIARTGWTTEELQSAISRYQFASKYDFVSLLIGVNNQYRHLGIIRYKEEFETLLNRSIELAGGKKDHVFVFSIPDYSVTPHVPETDADQTRKEVEEFNKLNKAISIQYKVSYIDVTEEFRRAKSHPELLAEDGLHPSALEYTKWAQKLVDAIGKQVKK